MLLKEKIALQINILADNWIIEPKKKSYLIFFFITYYNIL